MFSAALFTTQINWKQIKFINGRLIKLIKWFIPFDDRIQASKDYSIT